MRFSGLFALVSLFLAAVSATPTLLHSDGLISPDFTSRDVHHFAVQVKSLEKVGLRNLGLWLILCPTASQL